MLRLTLRSSMSRPRRRHLNSRRQDRDFAGNVPIGQRPAKFIQGSTTRFIFRKNKNRFRREQQRDLLPCLRASRDSSPEVPLPKPGSEINRASLGILADLPQVTAPESGIQDSMEVERRRLDLRLAQHHMHLAPMVRLVVEEVEGGDGCCFQVFKSLMICVGERPLKKIVP
jgi:hypothetical protein